MCVGYIHYENSLIKIYFLIYRTFACQASSLSLSLSEISECFTRYSRTGYQRAATARGLLVVIFDRITYLFIYLKRV